MASRPRHRRLRGRILSSRPRPTVEAMELRILLTSQFATPSVFVYHAPGTYPTGESMNAYGLLPFGNGSSTPVGYTPAQIRQAYGINNILFGSIVGDGTGQTIAIVDAYDNPDFVNSSSVTFSNSDLANFDKAFGIPDPPSFMKLNESGKTTGLPGTDPTGGWEAEEALDVEWAHALAPAASIVLVEAASSGGNDLLKAVTTAANLPNVSVISMSWGGGEASNETSQDSTFVTPSGHVNITFLASTGDSGSPGGYPAYSPNVVAVGGTALTLTGSNNYSSESGWSGSGGGTSQYETEPTYQKSVQSTGKRTIPDVSFDASPATGVALYDSYNNGSSTPWEVIGGTSLASPSWAALIAVADQGRLALGGTDLNGATQTLPDLYSLPATDFHDVTSGSNGGFSAGPGYDEVTGIGTPIANLLIPDLAADGLQKATKIAIVAQPPSSVIAGDPFAVAVAAETSTGQIVPSYNGSFTISLASGPSTGTLGGTLTEQAVDGVAVFPDLTISQLGSGYALQVANTDFGNLTTNTFNIIANPTPWAGTFYPAPPTKPLGPR